MPAAGLGQRLPSIIVTCSQDEGGFNESMPELMSKLQPSYNQTEEEQSHSFNYVDVRYRLNPDISENHAVCGSEAELYDPAKVSDMQRKFHGANGFGQEPSPVYAIIKPDVLECQTASGAIPQEDSLPDEMPAAEAERPLSSRQQSLLPDEQAKESEQILNAAPSVGVAVAAVVATATSPTSIKNLIEDLPGQSSVSNGEQGNCSRPSDYSGGGGRGIRGAHTRSRSGCEGSCTEYSNWSHQEAYSQALSAAETGCC
ncbi:hypothetical protein KR009_011196 [Drosophila setifemur]|nr:hypothetical protein KR009_011196 [Drosophila setifemur]